MTRNPKDSAEEESAEQDSSLRESTLGPYSEDQVERHQFRIKRIDSLYRQLADSELDNEREMTGSRKAILQELVLLQTEEAREWYSVFQDSLESPLTAGGELFGEAKALRREIENLTGANRSTVRAS